jgi:WD40 repeat protein
MPCVVELGSESLCYPSLDSTYTVDWSPDGTSLLAAGPGSEPVWVLETSGEARVLLPPDGSEEIRSALQEAGHGEPIQFVGPSYSSSGRHVAALANMRGGDAAYVMIVVDGDGDLVAMGHPSREFPGFDGFAWSPARDVLAYALGEPPYAITDLRLLDPATGDDRLLLSTGQGEEAPIISGVAWSPSGRWLAVAVSERVPGPKFPMTVRILDVSEGGPSTKITVDSGGTSDPLVGWAP